MAKAKRFLIREPNGEALLLDHAEAPGVVLSRAITQASRAAEPGVWEVVEYEDVLYRVHRLDPFEIRVEVMK